MSKSTTEPSEETPLSAEEIRDAINRSGYPFEVRLYERLRRGGFDGGLGMVVQALENEPAREIDLACMMTATYHEGDAHSHGVLYLVGAAKRPPPPSVFVGIAGAQPDAVVRQMRRRNFIGGVVSNVVLPENDSRIVEEALAQVGDSVRPLDSVDGRGVTVCNMWVLVRRRRDANAQWLAYADQTGKDERYFNDFRNTALVSRKLAQDVTHEAMRGGAEDLRLVVPALFLDQEVIRVYDVARDELRTEPRVCVHSEYDAGNGQVVRAATDVVSQSGLDDYMLAFRRAQQRLEENLRKHHELIRGAGAALLDLWKQSLLDGTE